jgi:hypothetical protein
MIGFDDWWGLLTAAFTTASWLWIIVIGVLLVAAATMFRTRTWRRRVDMDTLFFHPDEAPPAEDADGPTTV